MKSPTYSLNQLADAIRNHDRDEVEKFADLESIANSFMNQAFTQASEDKSADRWTELGQNMARGFLELIKPKLAATAKAKFPEYVEKGDFPKTTDEKRPPEGLSSALKNASTAAEFKGIASVKTEGKLAMVTLDFLGSDKNEVFPDLKMRNKDGYWQVIEVTNLVALIRKDKGSNLLMFG